jgi:hypothetical protein
MKLTINSEFLTQPGRCTNLVRIWGFRSFTGDKEALKQMLNEIGLPALPSPSSRSGSITLNYQAAEKIFSLLPSGEGQDEGDI